MTDIDVPCQNLSDKPGHSQPSAIERARGEGVVVKFPVSSSAVRAYCRSPPELQCLLLDVADSAFETEIG